MPTSPEITTPSNSSASRARSYRRVPHELEISPVRTPARRAARTASIIAVSGWAPAISRSIRPSASRTSSIAANRGSNSSSSIFPVSRSISSSRASGSSRKRCPIACGSSPSATQNAEKDWNRSVVRTPPKSTSSPRRRPFSATLRDFPRALGQLDHAVAELLEVGVVGHAGHRALVVALHEDGGLPQRERHVPADVGHRAAGALLVAADDLLAPHEARLARDAARELEHPQRRVVAVDPQRAQVAQVG